MSDKKEHSITTDRQRTNLLRGIEQPVLLFLCKIMPPFISPDMLTAIGMVGSALTCYSFVLAKDNIYFLLLAIFGFSIQWFGDSLDGRIAYYRNTPRKWFGFSLDLVMDWITTLLIGLGFYFYLPEGWKLLAVSFIWSYGWIMVLALLKYKLTDKYVIDAGLLGPTELRVGICLVLLLEVVFPGTLLAFAMVINVVLILVNLFDFKTVLSLAQDRDTVEKGNKK